MLESIYILILIAGFGGGVVRDLVGFIKYHLADKTIKFELLYFLLMMFLSGIVGILTAATVKELGLSFLGSDTFTPALAFIIGYAGGDFLENIYKIIAKKATIY